MIAAIVLALTGACNDDPTQVESEVLVVRRVGNSLELHNRSIATVYTFVAEQGTLALIDWIPCSDPQQCDGIAPGESDLLPLEDITGYVSPPVNVVVYHWQLVPASEGGYQPDEIRTLVIRVD